MDSETKQKQTKIKIRREIKARKRIQKGGKKNAEADGEEKEIKIG